MTRDDIIRMVREAEEKVIANPNLDWKQEFAQLVATHVRSPEWLARRTNAAIAAEREACADLVHELVFSPAMFATMDEWRGYKRGVSEYLDAIRARGEA